MFQRELEIHIYAKSGRENTNAVATLPQLLTLWT